MLTVEDKELLIKDLIKEDRHTTIKDYLELVTEIELIAQKSGNKLTVSYEQDNNSN